MVDITLGVPPSRLVACRRKTDPPPTGTNPLQTMARKESDWVSDISATESIRRRCQHRSATQARSQQRPVTPRGSRVYRELAPRVYSTVTTTKFRHYPNEPQTNRLAEASIRRQPNPADSAAELPKSQFGDQNRSGDSRIILAHKFVYGEILILHVELAGATKR